MPLRPACRSRLQTTSSCCRGAGITWHLRKHPRSCRWRVLYATGRCRRRSSPEALGFLDLLHGGCSFLLKWRPWHSAWLSAGALERQMMRCQGAQEVPGIQDCTRPEPRAMDLATKNALNGLADERRREGIDVSSLRDDAARLVASFHRSLDQEYLRRTACFVYRRGRWRCRIANITNAFWDELEQGRLRRCTPSADVPACRWRSRSITVIGAARGLGVTVVLVATLHLAQIHARCRRS